MNPADLGDDPYEILGVPRGSSDRVITTAHKQLARRFHPDIAGDHSTGRMMRINAALDAIRTAERRIEFDALDRWEANPGRTPDPANPRRHATVAGATATRPPRWTPERDGTGGAGPPPGRPSGSVLDFGRHKGWSLGEIARVDPGYLQWLIDKREGQPFVAEIDQLLRRVGFWPSQPSERATNGNRRRGVFRRG
ncbi:MAG: DnaJ domain-containing protein [Chloroflexota bacterium]